MNSSKAGALLLVMSFAGLSSVSCGDAASSSEDTACAVGSEGCTCTSGHTCDDGLVCRSKRCVSEEETRDDEMGGTGPRPHDPEGDGGSGARGEGQPDMSTSGKGGGSSLPGNPAPTCGQPGVSCTQNADCCQSGDTVGPYGAVCLIDDQLCHPLCTDAAECSSNCCAQLAGATFGVCAQASLCTPIINPGPGPGGNCSQASDCGQDHREGRLLCQPTCDSGVCGEFCCDDDGFCF